MTIALPEQGPSPATIERGKLVVSQPEKLKELTLLLESFENLDARVSERTGEDRSGDLGSGGAMTKGSAAANEPSARDKAIAKIPEPIAMKKKLQAHIRKEVQNLEKLAISAANTSRPGSAFRLNELYARIRRLNSLLADILESTVEVIRRLFIRVFIDHQQII